MKHLLLTHSFILFILISLISCQRQKEAASSPAFRSVYNQFDHFNYTDEVTKALDSFVSLHPDLGFSDRFDYYGYECGYYHVKKRDDIKALIYTDSLLMLVNTQKDEPGNTLTRQASANLARGSILFALKKYNGALQFFYQAKLAAEKSGDMDVISDLNYNMGMVMFRKLNYRAAAHYFAQGFISPQNNQPFSFDKFFRMQEILNNVAESYLRAGEPDSALLYSARARDFINQNKNFYKGKEQLMEVAIAVINGTAGESYLLKHDNASGEHLLQKSIEVNSRPGYDNGNAIQMQLRLAQFYLDNRFDSVQPSKTENLLRAIQTGLDTFHNEEYEAKWSYLTSHYYDVVHNQGAALAYLKKAIDYDKKTEAEAKVLSETNIGTYFQTMQNQYEMQLLKKSSDIDKIYLVVAIILFVLLGIIVLLVWRYWHYSKQQVKTLTRLNRKVKRQKKKLEQTLAALNKRSEEKDLILKVIAHDLRNPISAINALTRLLKDDPTLDKEQTDCLDLISTASIESLELIESIMQIEDNGSRHEINRQLHDINVVVVSCVNQLKARAAAKNQVLSVDLPQEEQFVMMDADKIQRVIKNLLTNAIKFSHKNSTIQVSLKETADDVLITIKDQGIGIPKHLQDKVFDTFTEAKRAGTEDEKTFGLGLSICKQFVAAHGGAIWFSSEENKGTSFYVKLQKETVMQAIPEYQAACS